jgi:hypothetical protein
VLLPLSALRICDLRSSVSDAPGSHLVVPHRAPFRAKNMSGGAGEDSSSTPPCPRKLEVSCPSVKRLQGDEASLVLRQGFS